jgi:hypothetical protein
MKYKFFVHKKNMSAVKGVEFVSNTNTNTNT